jgi:sulfur-carrier protein
MQVTVEYTAQIKRAAGVGSEEFELEDNSTPTELLKQIVARHDELVRFLVTDSGAPQPTLLLFIGDEQARWDSEAALAPGARVTLMSPISGG